MVRTTVLLLSRAICGVVLVVAGIYKVQQPFDFLIAFYKYEIIGPPVGRYIAMGLPYLELTAGLALLSGILTRGAFLLSVILFATFAAVVASVLIRHLQVECFCFGFTPDDVSVQTLIRDLLLLAASIVGCFAQDRRMANECESDRIR